LAEPGADYVSVSGSLILEEGETSDAINITILEVKCKPFRSILICMTIRKVIFWNQKLATCILLEAVYVFVILKDSFDLNVKITKGQIIAESSFTYA